MNVSWAKVRRARKQHCCCECLATIEPGEHYMETTGVWDGRADRFRQCLFCGELMSLASSHPSVFHKEDAPTFEGLFAWLSNMADYGSSPFDERRLVQSIFPRVMVARAESSAKWHARMAIERGRAIGYRWLGFHIAGRTIAQRDMFRWKRAIGAGALKTWNEWASAPFKPFLGSPLNLVDGEGK